MERYIGLDVHSQSCTLAVVGQPGGVTGSRRARRPGGRHAVVPERLRAWGIGAPPWARPQRPSRAGALTDLTVRVGGRRVIPLLQRSPWHRRLPSLTGRPEERENECAAIRIPGSLLRHAPARDPVRPDRVPAAVHQARERSNLPRLYRPFGQAPVGLGADRNRTSGVSVGGRGPLGRSLPRATLPCRPLASPRRAADLPSPVSSRSLRARRSRRWTIQEGERCWRVARRLGLDFFEHVLREV